MLGLGNSIVNSTPTGGLVLLGTYTSDFASSDDGWVTSGTSGTVTITHNQTVGGRSGVLKVAYDADETVLFSIQKTTPWGESFEVGDVFDVQYSIFSEDNAPSDESSLSHFFQAGRTYSPSRRVDSGTADFTWDDVDSEGNQITAGSNHGAMVLGFSSQTNAPGAGDAVYFDSIVIKHYRPS